MSANTDVMSVTERALALHAEAVAEADEYAEQRHDELLLKTIGRARERLLDALPEFADARLAFLVDETTQDGSVLALVADGPDDGLRFHIPREGPIVLSRVCETCQTERLGETPIFDLIDLGFALAAPIGEHYVNDSWDPDAEWFGERCDGTKRHIVPVPPRVDPPARWKVERINTHSDLTVTLNAIEAEGYEPMWPPLMDGHVIAARHRG